MKLSPLVRKTRMRLHRSPLWRRWQLRFRHFVKRFIACFIVFGALYIAIFGLHAPNQRPTTDSQKIAAVRADISSLQLSAEALNKYNQDDQRAATEFFGIQSRVHTTAASLAGSLKKAPQSVTSEQRTQIQALVDQEQKAAFNFQKSYKIFEKALHYDPAIDFKLDIRDTALAERAGAASDGLTKTAVTNAVGGSGTASGLSINSTGQSLVTSAMQAKLTKQAACFKSLQDQLTAKDYLAATAIRQTCIASYSTIREQAIKDILSASYSQEYVVSSQEQSLHALKQLDKTMGQMER